MRALDRVRESLAQDKASTNGLHAFLPAFGISVPEECRY
jgi:hypothetical protein